MALRIARAQLAVAAAKLDALAEFYGTTLGFAVEQVEGRIFVPIGEDVLEFIGVRDGSHPFHHFALLVPGDRFDAAHTWIGERVERLIRDGDTVIAFDFWDARATYFHDPAGNIVELIAHAGVAERPGAGADFSAAELAGFSEVAIVVDQPADAVDALARVGLELWSGGAEQFAFVGAKARTLIISAPERGWLPTDRPAEAHAATVTVATGGTGHEDILLASAPERRVRRVRRVRLQPRTPLSNPGWLGTAPCAVEGSPYGTRLPLCDRMRASRNAPRRLSLGTTSRHGAGGHPAFASA